MLISLSDARGQDEREEGRVFVDRDESVKDRGAWVRKYSCMSQLTQRCGCCKEAIEGRRLEKGSVLVYPRTWAAMHWDTEGDKRTYGSQPWRWSAKVIQGGRDGAHSQWQKLPLGDSHHRERGSTIERKRQSDNSIFSIQPLLSSTFSL